MQKEWQKRKQHKMKRQKKEKKGEGHLVQLSPVHRGRQSPFKPQQNQLLQARYRDFGSASPPSIIKDMWHAEDGKPSLFDVPEKKHKTHTLAEHIRQYCSSLSKSEGATALDCILYDDLELVSPLCRKRIITLHTQ